MKCFKCGKDGNGNFCMECGAPIPRHANGITPDSSENYCGSTELVSGTIAMSLEQLGKESRFMQSISLTVCDTIKAWPNIATLHRAPIEEKLCHKTYKDIGLECKDSSGVFAVINLRGGGGNWIVCEQNGMVFSAKLLFCGSNLTTVTYLDLANMPIAFAPGQLGPKGMWCDDRKVVSVNRRVLFQPTLSEVPADIIIDMVKAIRDGVRSCIAAHGVSLSTIAE